MAKQEINTNGTQASVHVVLQGKGGVGKSFVSAILAQYFRTKSAPVHCLDTDPVNATFAQYRMLEAEHLKVLRRGTVHEKQFDALVDKVCRGDGVFIVDTGATTFVPLWNYILNEYFGEVTKDGKTVEEFKVAEEYAPKLVGTVLIRERNPHTYGDDVRQMLECRFTFDEAIQNADFSLVAKQRLTIVRRELFEQLDKLAIA
jgi:hypothetical protein